MHCGSSASQLLHLAPSPRKQNLSQVGETQGMVIYWQLSMHCYFNFYGNIIVYSKEVAITVLKCRPHPASPGSTPYSNWTATSFGLHQFCWTPIIARVWMQFNATWFHLQIRVTSIPIKIYKYSRTTSTLWDRSLLARSIFISK